MEELASVFLHSRTQAHVFHTRVRGTGALSLHLALEGYYTEIIPLIDGLVESYQGMYGLIEYKDVKGVDNNAEKDNIINYFTNILIYSFSIYYILIKKYIFNFFEKLIFIISNNTMIMFWK